MTIKKYILLFLLVVIGFTSSAKQYDQVKYALTGTDLMAYNGGAIMFSAIYPGITFNNLSVINNSNRKTTIQNTISLDLKNSYVFNENAIVKIRADIKYYPINSNLQPVTKTITLEINYKAGAQVKSNISNIYAFKNAYLVDITITSVIVAGDPGANLISLKNKLANFIELNIGFQEERLTRINYDLIPSELTSCVDNVTDELLIEWSALPDAEEYDLEYTFVDDYGDVYSSPLSPSNIRFNFKDNSTRVSLKETSYRLPLVFERGYLLYRVRAIGKGGNNLDLPVYCMWSGGISQGQVNSFPHANFYYLNTAHINDGMNWQVASTFAEEGKRSDIVKYFDGTFRARQSVTAMNLEHQLPYDTLSHNSNTSCAQLGTNKEREVIAGETIYDYQGRPAVNILPVPTNSLRLEYLKRLNISDQTNKPYDWTDFDRPNYTCPDTKTLYPKPYGSTRILGAAAYYSINNPNKLGFNAFIPNAEGFPFTQLSYLRDNTGRVGAQSGVGTTFQFGAGHVTRFYYATPNQEELDRMFGTDVGDALRYQKNAVIDANGQVSVTYINPEGKTIATALAGKTPDNLDALSNQATNSIDVSLMDKNIININDKTLIAEQEILVTSDNTLYTFDYGLTAEKLEADICTGNTICLDCIYDINISLLNEENCSETPLINYSGTVGNLLNKYGAVDLNCKSNTIHKDTIIQEYLNIGTYSLTKKITINQQAALAYVYEAFKDSCKSKWNDILANQLSHVDTMDCYRGCELCEQPPLQNNKCDTAYCKPSPNRCDNIRLMMLADISPGGQYAQFDRTANGVIDASNYPLSIFNPNNLLPVQAIILTLFTPPFATYKDLINNWLPEYAEKLLYMHPEYCMQSWCSAEGIDATLDFDMQVLSTEHYADAIHSELIVPGTNAVKPFKQILDKDPWFSNSQNATIKANLLSKLLQYGCPGSTIPADELAMRMAYCAFYNPPQNQQGSTPAMNTGLPCTLPTNPPYLSTHTFGSGSDSLDDLEWTFLRSLYLSAKNEFLQLNMNTFADTHSCNSRCVGAKDYNGWAQFSNPLSNFVTQHNHLPCQATSNPFAWIYYKDKQSRFSTGIDNILQVLDENGVSINTSSVTDYENPCNYLQAISNQSASINQQVANTFCAGVNAGDDTTVVANKNCSQPTTQLNAINNLLIDIFNFKATNNHYPSSAQLTNNFSATFQDTLFGQLTSTSIDTTTNLVINLNFKDKKGKASSCTIVLQKGGAINSWSNIRSIVSVTPDLSLAQNGITKDFIIQVIVGPSTDNLKAVNVNGHSSCWAMNECPTGKTLCDSITEMPPYPYANNCVRDLLATAYANADLLYHQWVDSMKNDLLQRYNAKCLKSVERLNMAYDDKQYQYTLYYYDQAGNLVKTVPPSGVNLYDHTQALKVYDSRKANYNNIYLPSHVKATLYRYNTLNELIWQKTPDAGESNFYYDGLGRIVASQNPEQLSVNCFSYTRYDLLGRMVESGKLKAGISDITNALANSNYNSWSSFVNNQSYRVEITLTHYDDPYSIAIDQKFGTGQRNLRKRVASVFSFANAEKLAGGNYIHATHYTYDIEGNVNKLIQDYPNGIIGDKTIEYAYDLQSGKVNQVTYQRGALDQFIHRYSYDAANRLTQVKTSTNNLVWETDATYKYYRHGPLARVELGTDKVQGLDYMYTLQGWIKGVNGTTTSPETDMGQDGIINTSTPPSPPQTVTDNGITSYSYSATQLYGTNYNGPGYGAMHNTIASDAFGYVLDYFKTDYSSINGNSCLATLNSTAGSVNNLYNGNISRMYTQIQTLGNNGYNYKYDQLNRITSQHAWMLTGNIMAMLPKDAYGSTFIYDADGNIINQLRNGTTTTPDMDNLAYLYYTNSGGTYSAAGVIPANATNKLAQVKDDVASANYAEDIDAESPNNYKYNLIGNLISDEAEHITNIGWNLQNKITEIKKSTGGSLKFQYDALGNRVMKEVAVGTTEQFDKTFYVRDATGNTMATYTYSNKVHPSGTGFTNTTTTTATPILVWSEAPIYGSSRLGIYAPNKVLQIGTANTRPPIYFSANRGYKQYELTNHLGNVLATITDRKIPITTNLGITYSADIISGQDYYAFGMLMPGRKFSNGNYRFGFNGKENDNEVKGVGDQQDYGFRIYDPRLGKFLSIDPISKQYPELTPYQFASNTPLQAIDLDGLEADYPSKGTPYYKCKHITIPDAKGVEHTYEKVKAVNCAQSCIDRARHVNEMHERNGMEVWGADKTRKWDDNGAHLPTPGSPLFLDLGIKEITTGFYFIRFRENMMNESEDATNEWIPNSKDIRKGIFILKYKMNPDENGEMSKQHFFVGIVGKDGVHKPQIDFWSDDKSGSHRVPFVLKPGEAIWEQHGNVTLGDDKGTVSSYPIGEFETK